MRKSNQILLNRRNKIFNENPTVKENSLTEQTQNKIYIGTMQRNFVDLGYMLSDELVNDLAKHYSKEDLIKTLLDMENILKDRLGAGQEYNPMYKHFPDSVMNMDKDSLYFDAWAYAMSGFTLLPDDIAYQKIIGKETERGLEIQRMSEMFKNLKQIELGDINELGEIIKNVMSSPMEFSPTDKVDLDYLRMEIENFNSYIPDTIPNKENLTYLVANYAKKMNKLKLNKTNPYIDKCKTATDVMRVIVVRSGYSSDMTEKRPKIKQLQKDEIMQYAKMFVSLKNVEQDIQRNKELFKRINEQLHFRKIKDKKLQTLIDKVYNNTLEKSFNSKKEKALKEMDFKDALNIYNKNPGQMGADIIRLIRMVERSDNKEQNFNALKDKFSQCIKKMSIRNIIKLTFVIQNASIKKDVRLFAANKGLSKPYAIANKENPINKDFAKELTEIVKNELPERYENKRPMDKVYLDKSLKGITLPGMERTKSAGETLPYGSRIDIDCKNKVRAFCWWTNGKDSDFVDIDLSAQIYDKNFKTINSIGFYNLKSYFAQHSGDIRNGGKFGGKGVSEFIDIDLDKLKEKYGEDVFVGFSVKSFSGETFKELPCNFGMLNADMLSKEAKLFDARDVKVKFDLNGKAQNELACLYDVKENKMIYVDRMPTRVPFVRGLTNMSSRLSDEFAFKMAYERKNSLNLYDLISAHIQARGGEITDDKELANQVFTVFPAEKENFPNAVEFMNAFETDKITGDLMSDEKSAQDIAWEKEQEELAKLSEMEIAEER